MNKIKEGALVKVWDNDISEFQIGKYILCEMGEEYPYCIDIGDYPVFFINAVSLPDELAGMLEGLE